MNKWIFSAALLLLAACTQDELTQQAGTLPEGMYPLQIGRITLSADVSEQPWGADAPQSRVTENDDRTGSVWQNGDDVHIQLGGNQATYDYGGNHTLYPQGEPLYWTKTTDNVTAWHPGNGTVNLADQSEGLAYVLKATVENASYKEPVSLDFSHQLAKVRVKLTGEKAGQATNVQIWSYTTCTHTGGMISTEAASEGWIKMYQVTNSDETYWEANVVPGHTITKFRLNETTEGTLDGNGLTPLAAKVNTLTLTVKKASLKPVGGQFTVNTGDEVIIRDYDGDDPIVVNGNATITLENSVKINASTTNAITIADNAEVVLNIVGEGHELVSTNGCGIQIGKEASITINGEGRDKSKLVVTGSQSHPAIGFEGATYAMKGATCKGIEIKNIFLCATGGVHQAGYAYSPATIGLGMPLYGWIDKDHSQICGYIRITDSYVSASSKGGACIGMGSVGILSSTINEIIISNSELSLNAQTGDFKHQGACIGFGAVDGNKQKPSQIGKIEISNVTFTDCKGFQIVGKGNNPYDTAAPTLTFGTSFTVNGTNCHTYWNSASDHD